METSNPNEGESSPTTSESAEQATTPSYLEEIKRDYAHVSALRAALKALVENTEVLQNHRKRFTELVAMFRDQLAFHFALQEAAGYFKDTLDNVPRLSELAARLRNQHVELFNRICEIANEAEEMLTCALPEERIDLVTQRLREFDCALQQHEKDEAELLCEATDRDIGGEG